MTSELLLALGKMNLAAAAAILVVILARKPARNFFGARQAYRLWLLVPLAALAVLIPARTVLIGLEPVVAEPMIFDDAAAASFADFETVLVTQPAWSIDPWIAGSLLWLAGMIAMGAWLARKQSEFVAEERKGRAGPAVVGVLRQRIVTPSDFEETFNAREQAVIIAHEKTHIARHDARFNALAALARCVFWFNPLVHLAAHLMRIDQELACDAQVIERHPKVRRTYAEAMLKAELAGRTLPLGCYWPAGAKHPLTERIAMLKLGQPGRARRTIGVVSLLALSAGAGLAAWAAQPERTEYYELQSSATEQPLLVEAPSSGPEEIAKALLDQLSVPAPADEPAPAPEVPQQQPPKFPPQLPEGLPPGTSVPGAADGPAGALEGVWRLEGAVDWNSPVTVTGSLVKADWRNPNALLHLQDASGKLWVVALATPNTMLRLGWNRNALAAGAAVTAQGYLATDKSCSPGCGMFARPDMLKLAGALPIPSALKQADDAQPPQPVQSQEQPQQQPQPARDYAPFKPPVDANGMTVFVPVYAQSTNIVDPARPMTLSGTVTDVKWVNPSMEIHVREASGRNWVIKSGTPNSVLRLGGTREIIKTGAKITAQGHQHRDRACTDGCFVFVAPNRMTLDGKALVAQDQPPAPAPEQPQPAPASFRPWGPKPATLDEAIRTGNAWHVPDLGGEPRHIVAALKQRFQIDPAFAQLRDAGTMKGFDDVMASPGLVYRGGDTVRSVFLDSPDGRGRREIRLHVNGYFALGEPQPERIGQPPGGVGVPVEKPAPAPDSAAGRAIDIRVQEAKLSESMATLEIAKQRVKMLEMSMTSLQQRFENGVVTKDYFDTAKGDLEMARLEVRAAEARVELARLELEKARLRQ